MNYEIDDNPEKLLIPLEISKIIYENWNAELTIMDNPDQIYGKALQGKGEITFKNGNQFVGELHNGMMHGQGVFTWANGVVYTGEFQYNVIKGKGQYQWTDGSTYEGEVDASLRNGYGIFNAPNQEAVYEGYWKDGMRDGKGKITFKSGAIYEGNFQQGKKNGDGKMTYPSGNYYEGQWQQDKKCGYGTMNWLTAKEKYYGNWKNNLQNGFGVHIWLENRGEGKQLRNRYEGEWLNGERHGFGTFYYANGSKYEGEWKHNLKDGYAIFIEDNGNIQQGLFRSDRFVQENSNQESILNNTQLNNVPQDSLEDQQLQNQDKRQSQNIVSQINKNIDKKNSKIQSSQLQSPKKISQNVQNSVLKQTTTLQKKRDIEVNPFTYLIDISDLTENLSEEDAERVQRDTQNMLLRHNTFLKMTYKQCSSNQENLLGENSFSMDLQTFWNFLKESKVLDGDVTLASVNRLFYQGAKTQYNMNTEEGELQKQIELLQKIGRPVTLQELKELKFLDLALTAGQEKKKLEWNRLDYNSQNNSENKKTLFEIQEFDLHNGKRSSIVDRSWAYSCEVVEKLKELYNKLTTENRSKKFGYVDKTVKLKNLTKALEEAGYVDDKAKIIQVMEMFYDPQSTLSQIDILEREQQAFLKKRKNKRVKDNQSVTSTIPQTIDYTKQKIEQTTKLFEKELLFNEFQDFIYKYLFKLQKDIRTKQDAENKQNLINHLQKIIDQSQKVLKQPKKAQRVWPTSQKDNAKKNLALQRQREQKEAEEKKKKDEEKRREARERARMQLDDINVPSDIEDDDDEEDDDF
ncbi:hypothetical protein PPERSA_05497 [Pseudocohnilembus persalinus]|uniref:MORN motif n=1 Tax=Pseudocohnilembus persalinus TaxID=266149 RepID=A0A0V0QCW4_PSEPJ|nr:hypothetical protein PPERSA_05497 [Pseudocohnilembus persalinus]|eukprot:KRW99994.1 hypothetical protein PPERSA_05497 [Pseudocohnilembus persalinus]